jgi:hypothetical protein
MLSAAAVSTRKREETAWCSGLQSAPRTHGCAVFHCCQEILSIYRAYVGCTDQHECAGEQNKYYIEIRKTYKKVGRRMCFIFSPTSVETLFAPINLSELRPKCAQKRVWFFMQSVFFFFFFSDFSHG